MTVLFSRAAAIKLKVMPQLPANLYGGIGIEVVKANGNYTVDLAYKEFAPAVTLPVSPNLYTLIYDRVLDNYTLVPQAAFTGVPDAPINGTTYGRKDGGWSSVLNLAGGTLTGALILNADP